MFGTIRRHQTWLWAVIVTLTVVSFVYFWGNPNQKGGNGRQVQENYGTIKGREVTKQDFQDAYNEVVLQYRLTHGDWPERDQMAKQFGYDPEIWTYRRLMFIRELEDRGIKVSDDTVRRMASEVLRPARDRSITPEEFERQILSEHKLTLVDFENFLRHEIGIQQLMAIISVPGKLATPQEAQALFRHDNEEIVSEMAYFSASNYIANIVAETNQLMAFFQRQQAVYKIPDRIQVNYVKYEITNFLAEADQRLEKMTNFGRLGAQLFPQNKNLAAAFISLTNLNEAAETLYRMRGTNFYKDLAADAAKAKIKDEIREEVARTEARQEANTFADQLLSIDSPKPEMFNSLATTNKLTVKTTPPFARNDEPPDLKLFPAAAERLFDLTPEAPFSGTLEGPDAVYVAGFSKFLPSENPPFETIRQKVEDDFRHEQAVNVARQNALNLQRSFTNAPTPIDFQTKCIQLKGDYIKLPPFSLASRSLPQIEDRVSLGQLQNVAFTTGAGKLSEVDQRAFTQDGAFVLHIIDRKAVDPEKMREEFPTFLASYRQQRQNDVFNEWFQKQIRQEPFMQQIIQSRQGKK